MSASSEPPYKPLTGSRPPSTTVSPPATFILALPKRTTPPQLPRTRLPAGWLVVKTIGFSFVPLAISLEPRVTIRVPLVAESPIITVPGSIVSVAPLVTYTKFLSSYTLFAVHVVLAVISELITTCPNMTFAAMIAKNVKISFFMFLGEFSLGARLEGAFSVSVKL